MSVLGLGELLAGFAASETEVIAATEEGTRRGAELVAEAWTQGIIDEPLVLTGAYEASIQVAQDGETATAYTDAPYANILEYGDSRQAAHPIAQRSADENGDAVTGAVADQMREALR